MFLHPFSIKLICCHTYGLRPGAVILSKRFKPLATKSTNKAAAVASLSFCSTVSERVYNTANGCEIGFVGTPGLQAVGAGGL